MSKSPPGKFTNKHQVLLTRLFLLMVSAAGIFLRLRQYTAGRSFWADEAKIVNNILERSYLELLSKPLLYNQSAPPGFLVVEKFFVQIIGNHEFAFRLFPVAASCLSVPLIYFISKRISGSFSSTTTLLLFSISPSLIYYSSEVKQYALDLFLYLLISLLLIKSMEENYQGKFLIFLGLTGTIAIWFSNPVIFVLFGASCILWFNLIRHRSYQNLLRLFGVSSAWAVSFLIQYVLVLRSAASNDYLLTFWKDSFAPLPPWVDPAWYLDAFRSLLADPLNFPVSLLTAGLLLIGACAIGTRKWRYLFILLVPLITALAASAFQKYPFSGRFLLFSVPSLLILLSEGIDWIRIRTAKYNSLAASGFSLLIILYLVFQPLKSDIQNAANPVMLENIRPVVLYIKKNMSAADSIYVYYAAAPAFKYYSSRYNLSFKEVIAGSSNREQPEKYIPEIDQLQGKNRIWVIFSHRKKNEEKIMLDRLDYLGHSIKKYIDTGASAYLYDLSK